jgi:uncharacterized membrane protein
MDNLTSSKMTYFSRVFYMLNYGGYSIGSFTLPFVQSFFGPGGGHCGLYV